LNFSISACYQENVQNDLFYLRRIPTIQTLSVGSPDSLVWKFFGQIINILILSKDIQFDFETKIENANF